MPLYPQLHPGSLAPGCSMAWGWPVVLLGSGLQRRQNGCGGLQGCPPALGSCCHLLFSHVSLRTWDDLGESDSLGARDAVSAWHRRGGACY